MIIFYNILSVIIGVAENLGEVLWACVSSVIVLLMYRGEFFLWIRSAIFFLQEIIVKAGH